LLSVGIPLHRQEGSRERIRYKKSSALLVAEMKERKESTWGAISDANSKGVQADASSEYVNGDVIGGIRRIRISGEAVRSRFGELQKRED